MSTDSFVPPPANTPTQQSTAADALLQQLQSRLQVNNTDHALQLLHAREAALQRQKNLVMALAVLAVLAPVLIAIRESQWNIVWNSFALLFPAAGLTAWSVWRQRSTLSQLSKGGTNFYDDWKRDLRDQLRSALGGVVVMSMFATGLAVLAVSGRFGALESVFVCCVSLFTAIGVGRVLSVEVRNLRSEYRIAEESNRD